MDYLKLTLPNNYSIEWTETREGLMRSWPESGHLAEVGTKDRSTTP